MKINNLLKFLERTEKLKHTLRHAWTKDANRQESTAEHTWHMAIMAIALAPLLRHKVNLGRTLKLIAVHDLGETVAGDIPAFKKTDYKKKQKKEEIAVNQIARFLPPPSYLAIVNLYQEYKEKQSKEAIFVKMLDIIDVIFQHLVSDISTWSKEEYTFNLQKHSEKYFEEEPLMLKLYNEIHRELEKKVNKARPRKANKSFLDNQSPKHK